MFECVISLRCAFSFSYEECALFDFESERLDGWTRTGTAFNNQPTYGDNVRARSGSNANLKGSWFIGTFENRPSPTDAPGKVQGDGPKGTLTSPTFQIQGTKLRFLIGGSANPDHARTELLIGGSVVMKTALINGPSNSMVQQEFDVTSYRGESANVRIVDDSSGGWGIIMIDHIEDSCYS